MSTKIINVLGNDKFEDVFAIFKNTPAKEVIFVLPRKSRVLSSEDHFSLVAESAKEQGKTVLLLASNPEINALAQRYNIGVLVNEKSSPKPKINIKPVHIPMPSRVEVAVSNARIEPEPELVTTVTDDVQEVTEEELEDKFEGDDNNESDEDEEKVDSDQDDLEGEDDVKELGERIVEQDEDENIVQELSRFYEEKDGPIAELTAVRKTSKNMSDIMLPPSEDEGSVSVKVKPQKEPSPEVGIRRKNAPTNIKEPVDNIESVWQSRRESPKKIYAGPRPGFKLPGFPVGKLVSNLSKRTFTLFGITVVILFGIVLYVSMGEARIIIKPRTHTLDFPLKVYVSDQFSAIDLDLKSIPGQFFSIEKGVEETFQATGERDVAQKARGKITVYNEYGTTPQTLIATTRFESSGGLLFRTLKTVTIPGTTVQNGNITPGKVVVEVIADKAGKDYNIAAGKFTIPAFKEKGDNDRYQKFYGTSEEAVKGGIVGKAKVITEKDYLDAKKKIEERIVLEAEQEFKGQASGLKILNLPAPSLGDITSTAQIDEAADTFTLSASARLENIGFKESDLHELIAQYVGDINNLLVLAEKIKLEFSDIKIDKDKKILEFNVLVKGPAYSRIENDRIISELAGKNEIDIKEYIKDKDSIASARVILSPFWVRKVPKETERVKLELDYN